MRKTTLCLVFLMHTLLTSQAHALLIDDPGGLNISLFVDGSTIGLLSPDFFTGYNPTANPTTDIHPLPVGIPDGSEMIIELTSTSILITQFVSGFVGGLGTPDGNALGWTMRFDEIDFASPITDAVVAMSSFPVGLTTMVSADSVAIGFDGGFPLNSGESWEATIDVITDAGVVSEPVTLALLSLGILGMLTFKRRRPV